MHHVNTNLRMVECEVFENEIYTLLTGWGPGSWASRLTYSDRKGELSSAEFPEVRLPSDFKWMDDWHLDKTYAACDKDGWSYATNFNSDFDGAAWPYLDTYVLRRIATFCIEIAPNRSMLH